MSSVIVEEFLDSLKAQLSPSAASLCRFIQEKTFLNGKPFSFNGHEYQKYITELIESHPGWTFAVSKPSQIGLSEIFQRIVLARMALRPGEGVLISFPSIKMSQEVIKTRLADIIDGSPLLKSLQDPNVDSASVKKFHNGSILFGLAGSTTSSSSLLSRPISLVLIDEVDRQDPDVYSGFRSRQTHTAPEDRLTLLISTPTAPGVGIDAEVADCEEQHFANLRCECGHLWEPDYYTDIKIPDHDESLLLLTKIKAARLRVDLAYLECPNCKCHITADNSTVEYVIVHNPEGTRKKMGISLSPFVALSFITPADLVESSLIYTSAVEFRQQGLGKTTALGDSSITVDRIHFCHDDRGGARVFGLDMGKQCAFLSGVMHSDTTVHVDRQEIINLPDLEAFIADFFKQYPTVAGVMDSQPYSDLVYRMVKKHPRLYSAIYVDPMTPMPELFKLVMHDKYGEVVRQININKNKAMDMMAGELDDFITFAPGTHNNIIIQHMTDMRRVRDYRYEEMVYKWVKSRGGVDHFFHASTYLHMAKHLAYAGIAHGGAVAPVQIFKFRHVPKVEDQRRP